MRNHEVCLVVNPKATKSKRDLAMEKIPRLWGEYNLLSVPFSRETEGLSCKKIVVIGGESTIKTVIGELIRRKEDNPEEPMPAVALVGGGSTNVSKKSIEEADNGRGKVVLAWEEFRDATGFSEEYMFKPGLVFVGNENREDRFGGVFNVEIDTGVFGRMIGRSHEWRQKVPRSLRSYAVYASNLLKMLPKNFDYSNVMDIVSTSKFLGRAEVFPNQEFLGDDFAEGKIQAQSKVEALGKLELTLGFWQAGWGSKIPKRILDVKYGLGKVKLESRNDDIFVDGDIGKGYKGDLFVRRSKHAIPIVVFK
ncbi:hypothetical protein C4559_03880 [Candidatus Microgenomates bacterium]|nr:MAG: hypothetical protein C4559_03880 [Candidatus Microgenomates bacterium]